MRTPGEESWSRQRLLGRPGRRARGILFFSSGRRHTGLQGDWSSGVCSSDLMLRADLAVASAAVAATSARSAKIALLADALARLEPEEVPAGVAFLSGSLLQRQIGVGWADRKSVV